MVFCFFGDLFVFKGGHKETNLMKCYYAYMINRNSFTTFAYPSYAVIILFAMVDIRWPILTKRRCLPLGIHPPNTRGLGR